MPFDSFLPGRKQIEAHWRATLGTYERFHGNINVEDFAAHAVSTARYVCFVMQSFDDQRWSSSIPHLEKYLIEDVSAYKSLTNKTLVLCPSNHPLIKKTKNLLLELATSGDSPLSMDQIWRRYKYIRNIFVVILVKTDWKHAYRFQDIQSFIVQRGFREFNELESFVESFSFPLNEMPHFVSVSCDLVLSSRSPFIPCSVREKPPYETY